MSGIQGVTKIMEERGQHRLSSAPKILNLGSGMKPVHSAVNVDKNIATQPDVVHDLNQRPWPFETSSFHEIAAYDVLEHLDDVVATMEEIHRVCEPGAVVRLTVPHFSSSNAFTDITHRHHFGCFSFDYFTGDSELAFYTGVRFSLRKRSLIFHPSVLNKVVHRLANWRPDVYERKWVWMCPAWFLYFELEVLKK